MQNIKVGIFTCRHNIDAMSFLYNPPNELKKKIKLFIENPDQIKKMGKESLKIVKNKFSFEKRNKIIKKIYEEAVRN